MSRNGSGTYTLPSGNPVVTGTTISSTWANNTLTDIATALSGSIAADGQTPITGSLIGTSGTVTFGGTGQTKIPSGTTAQRSASPSNGMIRYNTDTNLYEGYRNGSWLAIVSSNADSVVYNEGGTSAVDQTVESKLQETVSVADFGAVGDGVTDDYTAFVNAIAALPAKGGALYIPPTTTNIYRLSQTLSIRKPIHMYGDVMGANNTTGTTLYFDANVSGLVFGAYNTSLYTTITPDGALGSQYSVLENFLILSAGGATNVDGVVLRVQMTCRNVVARGFKRYGFRIYNTIGGGGSIEGDGNQWLLDNCKAIYNGDYGFYVNGDDSNTGVANKCFAQLNGTYGFYDNSLIGNTYIGCDTAGNTTGSFYSDRASSAVSIIGLWEDGAGTSVLGSNVTSIGGNGGKISSASAGFHMASGVALNAPYKYQNATGAQTIGSFLGYKDTSMTAYAWGATSESAGLNAWTLKFDTTYNVWYTQYANSSSFQPIAYPNSTSALYTNKGFTGAIFQNGYAVKNAGTAYSSSLVRLLGTAAPVSGTYQQGDIVYNSAPTSGTYIGWVCTVAGTPGTWKTFGLIS